MGVTNGEGTQTTRSLPVAGGDKRLQKGPKSKGFGGGVVTDPAAKSIFNDLMSTVDPAVLKSWTPEEIDKAVAMIQQQHPNINEGRIRNLIKVAQRRSQ
jgi:hypothetical protein